MEDLRIDKIEYMNNYCIRLYLSNGHQVIYNMQHKIKTVRFFEIANSDIFMQGELIEKRVIRWSENIEISLDEILMHVAMTNARKSERLMMRKRKEK